MKYLVKNFGSIQLLKTRFQPLEALASWKFDCQVRKELEVETVKTSRSNDHPYFKLSSDGLNKEV